jgi:hypothetical protein
MTRETNRRAVLGAVLAAGAIGVAPIASGAATAAEPVSGQAGLDAGLFALIAEAREIGARVEAGLRVLEEAEKRMGEMDGERYQQLWDERFDAYDRVAKTRARTLGGVLAKLALVAPDFDDESASELPGEMGMSPEILFSLAVDFKELKAGQTLSGGVLRGTPTAGAAAAGALAEADPA